VYRPGINRFLRFVFIIPLFLLTHCGMAQILGIPKHEAAELLRAGNLDFIQQANLPAGFSRAAAELEQLNRIHPAAAFYSGLLIGNAPNTNPRNRELELLLFSAALDSPSFAASREAALRLIPLVLETQEAQEVRNILSVLDSRNLNRRQDLHLSALRAACLYRLGSYNEARGLFSIDHAAANLATASTAERWGKAISLLASWKVSPSETLRQEISDFLFTIPSGEILRWANREARSLEALFEPEEFMVLAGRVLSGNHRAVLLNMTPALSDCGGIFFRYPNLIPYLGRAFQFTPAMRTEGLGLFETWITRLDEKDPSANDERLRTARYMSLFFSGRIERARGNHSASSEFFTRALEFAPNDIQADACIWYILMNTLASNPSAAPTLVIGTMPQWRDLSTFSAILDRVSSNLARQRRWDDILEIFLHLEARGPSASLAQYAWITGRALEEGFIRSSRSAESFFRVAYETESASFYYRAMAASRLGLNIALPRGNPGTRRQNLAQQTTIGYDAEFLLGFFEYGATAFVLPYLRALEESLSFPELRKVAEAFGNIGQWQESLRLVARYTRRSDYVFDIQDLYLAHPRPYLELIERHSREEGIGPELFFGLVRTESHFMRAIGSHAGALGLAQLMPATAEDMATRIARRGGPDYRNPTGIDLTDPEINIHLGAFYLRHLVNNLGNTMLALKAYNGGQGRVRRWLAEDRQLGALPMDLFLETIEFPETREYGRRVLSAAAVYGYLYYGMTMEEVAASFFR